MTKPRFKLIVAPLVTAIAIITYVFLPNSPAINVTTESKATKVSDLAKKETSRNGIKPEEKANISTAAANRSTTSAIMNLDSNKGAPLENTQPDKEIDTSNEVKEPSTDELELAKQTGYGVPTDPQFQEARQKDQNIEAIGEFSEQISQKTIFAKAEAEYGFTSKSNDEEPTSKNFTRPPLSENFNEIDQSAILEKAKSDGIEIGTSDSASQIPTKNDATIAPLGEYASEINVSEASPETEQAN